MPKPDEFSLFGLYGNREVFQQRLNEGFTELAFASGPEVNGLRIVAAFVFYHPDGRVATFEHIKDYTMGTSVRGVDQNSYTEQTFAELVQKQRLEVGKKFPLRELLKDWET